MQEQNVGLCVMLSLCMDCHFEIMSIHCGSLGVPTTKVFGEENGRSSECDGDSKSLNL